MSDEKAPAAEPTKLVGDTAACDRCKRQMWGTYLTDEAGKRVCNAKNRSACDRLAKERKPRSKVST